MTMFLGIFASVCWILVAIAVGSAVRAYMAVGAVLNGTFEKKGYPLSSLGLTIWKGDEVPGFHKKADAGTGYMFLMIFMAVFFSLAGAFSTYFWYCEAFGV